MNRRLLFISLCFLSLPLSAVELFGIQLESTNRDELRGAVQQSGAELISEGNDQQWFDIYDSSTLAPGSRHLYLGFVRSSGAFSFAEYEFRGIDTKQLVGRLQARYGVPDEVLEGRFISDQRYLWNRQGLVIELSSDWKNYRVVLTYRHTANLQLLLDERQQAFMTSKAVSTY